MVKRLQAVAEFGRGYTTMASFGGGSGNLSLSGVKSNRCPVVFD